jgi:steroid delta-isomerase-like uncharacterized protein
MSAEENIATIKRMIQAFNDRDLTVAPQVVTPGFVRHDLAGALKDTKGREELSDFFQQALKAIPDAQVKMEDIFATENRAAGRGTFTGTHQGEFLGIPPTGKKVKFSAINLYNFEDGKVAAIWQLIDAAGFLRQIGALTA